jgi:hypothetical protein
VTTAPISSINGQATHTAFSVRLNLGVGFEVMYIAAPSEE